MKRKLLESNPDPNPKKLKEIEEQNGSLVLFLILNHGIEFLTIHDLLCIRLLNCANKSFIDSIILTPKLFSSLRVIISSNPKFCIPKTFKEYFQRAGIINPKEESSRVFCQLDGIEIASDPSQSICLVSNPSLWGDRIGVVDTSFHNFKTNGILLPFLLLPDPLHEIGWKSNVSTYFCPETQMYWRNEFFLYHNEKKNSFHFINIYDIVSKFIPDYKEFDTEFFVCRFYGHFLLTYKSNESMIFVAFKANDLFPLNFELEIFETESFVEKLKSKCYKSCIKLELRTHPIATFSVYFERMKGNRKIKESNRYDHLYCFLFDAFKNIETLTMPVLFDDYTPGILGLKIISNQLVSHVDWKHYDSNNPTLDHIRLMWQFTLFIQLFCVHPTGKKAKTTTVQNKIPPSCFQIFEYETKQPLVVINVLLANSMVSNKMIISAFNNEQNLLKERISFKNFGDCTIKKNGFIKGLDSLSDYWVDTLCTERKDPIKGMNLSYDITTPTPMKVENESKHENLLDLETQQNSLGFEFGIHLNLVGKTIVTSHTKIDPTKNQIYINSNHSSQSNVNFDKILVKKEKESKSLISLILNLLYQKNKLCLNEIKALRLTCKEFLTVVNSFVLILDKFGALKMSKIQSSFYGMNLGTIFTNFGIITNSKSKSKSEQKLDNYSFHFEMLIEYSVFTNPLSPILLIHTSENLLFVYDTSILIQGFKYVQNNQIICTETSKLISETNRTLPFKLVAILHSPNSKFRFCNFTETFWNDNSFLEKNSSGEYKLYSINNDSKNSVTYYSSLFHIIWITKNDQDLSEYHYVLKSELFNMLTLSDETRISSLPSYRCGVIPSEYEPYEMLLDLVSDCVEIIPLLVSKNKFFAINVITHKEICLELTEKIGRKNKIAQNPSGLVTLSFISEHCMDYIFIALNSRLYYHRQLIREKGENCLHGNFKSSYLTSSFMSFQDPSILITNSVALAIKDLWSKSKKDQATLTIEIINHK